MTPLRSSGAIAAYVDALEAMLGDFASPEMLLTVAAQHEVCAEWCAKSGRRARRSVPRGRRDDPRALRLDGCWLRARASHHSPASIVGAVNWVAPDQPLIAAGEDAERCSYCGDAIPEESVLVAAVEHRPGGARCSATTARSPGGDCTRPSARSRPGGARSAPGKAYGGKGRA